jgi:hypothetical protein
LTTSDHFQLVGARHGLAAAVPPPSVEVVEDLAIPPEFMRAVLRLPLSAVPEGLRGLVAHLAVDRAAIPELVKRTSGLPHGVSVRTAERHLRIR